MPLELPKLWPHQTRGRALLREAARRQLDAGRTAYGLLGQMATGGGKTRLGLELTVSHLSRPATTARRTLWIAHRAELVDQPARRMLDLGWPRADLCVIKAGRVEGPLTAPLTIAGVQTLAAMAKRGEELPPATFVVLDEARHYASASASWHTVAGAYLDAVRLGLDATPARADDSPLVGLFDELVSIADIGELTEAGFLAPARMFSPEESTKDLAADPVDFYREHCRGRSALVFAANVKHARTLTAEFVARGITAACVTGKTKWAEREATVEAFRSGEVSVLVGVDVFIDGFDAPRCSAVILARACGHLSTMIQMCGRGLRKFPGKRDCIIGDLRGARHRFGKRWTLAAPVAWSLTGKAKAVLEGLPPCVQCPECHAWNGGSTCPHCGASLPPPPLPKVTKKELREQWYAAQDRSGPDWELFKRFVGLAMVNGWSRRAPMMRFEAQRGYRPRYRFVDAERELLAEQQREAGAA